MRAAPFGFQYGSTRRVSAAHLGVDRAAGVVAGLAVLAAGRAGEAAGDGDGLG